MRIGQSMVNACNADVTQQWGIEANLQEQPTNTFLQLVVAVSKHAQGVRFPSAFDNGFRYHWLLGQTTVARWGIASGSTRHAS
jgi:hypothetical protein